MNIEELTIGQARELLGLFTKNDVKSHPYRIGKNYFIRTVTHHYTGTLEAVHDQELVLSNAAWIADDGRFADAVSKGQFNEVEPFTDEVVVIGRGSVVDATIVSFDMPRSQK